MAVWLGHWHAKPLGASGLPDKLACISRTNAFEAACTRAGHKRGLPWHDRPLSATAERRACLTQASKHSLIRIEPRLCAPRGAAWAAACAAAASCRWRRSAAPCRPGPPCARPRPPPGPRTGTAAAARLFVVSSVAAAGLAAARGVGGGGGARGGRGVRVPYPRGCSGSRCGAVHEAAAFTTGCARRPYADGSQGQ
jgi:hypothetical protein